MHGLCLLPLQINDNSALLILEYVPRLIVVLYLVEPMNNGRNAHITELTVVAFHMSQ